MVTRSPGSLISERAASSPECPVSWYQRQSKGVGKGKRRSAASGLAQASLAAVARNVFSASRSGVSNTHCCSKSGSANSTSGPPAMPKPLDCS